MLSIVQRIDKLSQNPPLVEIIDVVKRYSRITPTQHLVLIFMVSSLYLTFYIFRNSVVDNDKLINDSNQSSKDSELDTNSDSTFNTVPTIPHPFCLFCCPVASFIYHDPNKILLASSILVGDYLLSLVFFWLPVLHGPCSLGNLLMIRSIREKVFSGTQRGLLSDSITVGGPMQALKS